MKKLRITLHGKGYALMDVVFAERMLEAREFFQIGERFLYPREAKRGF
jgi:hypothetical protein